MARGFVFIHVSIRGMNAPHHLAFKSNVVGLPYYYCA